MALSVGPGELKTETVEEFISISDGQVRAQQHNTFRVACFAGEAAPQAHGSWFHLADSCVASQ
jgi:hypothetical protein